MDKRWIFILIIFIAGIACLFVIVDSSTTLAKASLKISGCDFTVPSSMNVLASGGKYVYLINKKNTEKIGIKGSEKGNYTIENYTTELGLLELNESVTNIEYTNITVGNYIMPTLCYQTVENDTFNQISVLYKCNHTFIIKSTGYHNNATLNDDVKLIVDSIRVDYKQKQD